MLGDAGQVGRGRVVGAPLGPAQHRVEPLGVEVAIIDLVSALPQLRDDRAMQRRRETVGERVREKDENTHRADCACRGCR